MTMDDNQKIFFVMLIGNAVISLVILYFGWRFKNNPPKKINRFFGYRTRRSMQNTDAWLYAHKCCGKIWLRLGKFTLPLSLAVVLLSYGLNAVLAAGLVAMFAQIVTILISCLKVENSLKNAFDEEGNRRE